ncbi:MAG: hypothetical protein ACW963_09350 [Candidatus Sifarchaeia archaeon]|jgi:hypothetical protein
MRSVVNDEAMIELLSNLYPPLTIKEIKDVLPDYSSNKDKNTKDILNKLGSTSETALPALFKSVVLEKRGKFTSEMKKKTESYFQDEVSLDAYKTDATIGKGKTVLNIDILGRKENNDISAFVMENLDIESFESFKTMLVTILSYAKISPVEIYLIIPKETDNKIVEYIKKNKALKYVKTSGTEIDAEFKTIIYESEISRTAILTIEKEDIFGDTVKVGSFSGSSFTDNDELKKFLLDNYSKYGEEIFRCKSSDYFDKKTHKFSFNTTINLASDVTEITQTTRYKENK